jgi:enamine deaminase RidA (YjgF/YER057c/UK114 family)
MSVEEKLQEMGLELPQPPQPAGSYTRAVRSGKLVFVSGQLPLSQGTIQFAGQVGAELDVEEAALAARLCGLNALAVLKAELGSCQDISRIVRLGGYIASAPGFYGQAAVLNGASDLFATVLGDKGIHARLAVGVSALPLNACIELEVIAEC